MAFQRGDVVLVPFPFTDLSAQRVRPEVIVSTSEYERQTGNIIVAQITSRPRNLATDYTLQDWQAAGLLRPSTVRAKLATISVSLVQFRTGRLTNRDMKEVDNRLRLALGL
ncbi:MAG: type II toxin-antitoxin system PemK/MazF family toxin [Armatimonadetes bacterium]|nr:type II toxin-antitoxin system PemK/MazF family toxin [Armatimonadota bacterium]